MLGRAGVLSVFGGAHLLQSEQRGRQDPVTVLKESQMKDK